MVPAPSGRFRHAWVIIGATGASLIRRAAAALLLTQASFLLSLGAVGLRSALWSRGLALSGGGTDVWLWSLSHGLGFVAGALAASVPAALLGPSGAAALALGLAALTAPLALAPSTSPALALTWLGLCVGGARPGLYAGLVRPFGRGEGAWAAAAVVAGAVAAQGAAVGFSLGSMALGPPGDAAIVGFGLALLAGAALATTRRVHWRVSAALVGPLIAGAGLVGPVGHALPGGSPIRTGLDLGAALLAVLLGVALTLSSVPLERWWSGLGGAADGGPGSRERN